MTTPARDYIVVIRAGSRLRFSPDEYLQVNVNADRFEARLTFQTRYVDEGFETPVPREMWIDARGRASSLDLAVTASTNAAIFFTTIISFCANGFAGDCRFHLAYDNTPGLQEREFFEQFVEDERGAPRPSRRISPSVVTEVINALGQHEHTERLRRAIGQYVLALRNWCKGEEILTLAHLYMGMEALVPIVRKEELSRLDLATPQELADIWGIELTVLDSTIRQQILFQGDLECHRDAKRASDGIEHGFLGFDEIRPLAVGARDKTATYLRCAITSLLRLSQEAEEELLGSKYERPVGTEGYIRYLWGQLLSDGDQLAPEGFEYPIVEWRFKVESFVLTDKEFHLSFSQSLTPHLAENVSFRPTRFEVYGPEGIVPNPPPSPSNLEPTITPSEPEFKQAPIEKVASFLQEAVREGNLEEIRIKTKDGKSLIVKPDSSDK